MASIASKLHLPFFDQTGQLFSRWYRAAILKPSITATVFFGFLSLISAIYFVQTIDAPGSLVIIIVLVMILSAIVGVSLIQMSLSPRNYASVIVDGRPVIEIFYFTARRIRRICRQFASKVKRADSGLSARLAEIAESDEEPEEKGKKYAAQFDERIARNIENKIRRLHERQKKSVRRLERMKLLAADELGIPPRRLCDHVYQFSPKLYEDRITKYYENWAEMCRDYNALKKPRQVKRFDTLVLQNRTIVKDINKRLDWQRQLIEYRGLHKYVYEFASPHSTSASMSAYIDGLVYESSRPHPKQDRFKFLARKQRAHPGFDLHTMLCRLIEHAYRKFPESKCTCQQGFLEKLSNLRNKKLWEAEDEAKRYCTALKPLSQTAIRYVRRSREEISENFQPVYEEFFRDVGGNRFVVIHSYSKTVREVLRNEHLTDLHLYFLITTPDDADDARLMKYELKSDERGSHINHIAAGDKFLLEGLLREQDRVMILLGAESIDGQNNVLHPRGFETLGAVINEIESTARCLVAVVAEGYKFDDKPFAESRFYTDHVDHVTVYGNNEIDLYVSDLKVFPSDWKGRINDILTNGHSLTRR